MNFDERRVIAYCSDCQGRTQFSVVYTGEDRYERGYSINHLAIECAVCGMIMPATVDASKGINPRAKDQLCGKGFPDVPEGIASVANEAYLCGSAGALSGAVVLARAVIEATAKEQGIVSGNLLAKIEEMANRQIIREYIKDGAHEIRHFGNDIAHGDFSDVVHDADVVLALELMDAVLEEVYQAPARVQKARQRRASNAGI